MVTLILYVHISTLCVSDTYMQPYDAWINTTGILITILIMPLVKHKHSETKFPIDFKHFTSLIIKKSQDIYAYKAIHLMVSNSSLKGFIWSDLLSRFSYYSIHVILLLLAKSHTH